MLCSLRLAKLEPNTESEPDNVCWENTQMNLAAGACDVLVGRSTFNKQNRRTSVTFKELSSPASYFWHKGGKK